MDAALVSALSAVVGSIVGGSASVATAWVTQRTTARHQSIGAEIKKREALYAEFISECSKLAIDALDHSLDTPDKILNIYALENRIRLCASEPVVAAGLDLTEDDRAAIPGDGLGDPMHRRAIHEGEPRAG